MIGNAYVALVAKFSVFAIACPNSSVVFVYLRGLNRRPHLSSGNTARTLRRFRLCAIIAEKQVLVAIERLCGSKQARADIAVPRELVTRVAIASRSKVKLCQL